MPRYAAPIDQAIIVGKFADFLTPIMIRNELAEQDDLDEWSDTETIIHGFEECSAKAINDLAKIEFSLENITLDPCDPFTLDKSQAAQWLGPQTWGDLTCIGCLGGGDWETPVAFIIYWDGTHFRGYVPKQGNSYDLKSKAAIGTAPDNAKERAFDIAAMKEDVLARIKVRT